MSSYERLPDLEDVSFEPSQQSTASSSSPATLPVPSQVVDGSVPTVLSAPVRDGVFNNLKAAPATKGDGKAFEELEPPSYAEAAHDRVPTYYETTVIASGFAEDGEVLIEGERKWAFNV
ncbi:hypothetical protein HKX48_006369 [Thoreauomyces humboldtii]|nr:hypothetical protein HKX48_006369 [Thoreauomyces humboldtii]